MADYNEKIKILEEKLKSPDHKNSDGHLTIKIAKHPDQIPGSRLNNPVIMCTLSNGSIAHIANPELWLPRLMGGGSYILTVFAPGSSGVALVDGIDLVLQGEPRSFPDLDVTDAPDWKGPAKIIYPIKQARQSFSGTTTVIGAPPGGTTPSTNPPQGNVSGTGGSGVPHPDMELRRVIEEQRAQMAAMQAQMAEAQRRAELQLAEERRQRERDQHQREMEVLRTKQEAEAERQRQEIAKLGEMLRELKNTPPATTKGPSLVDMIKEALPIVIPVITTHMTANAERERRAEERQAEVLKALQSRPTIDPMVKEMMEAQNANQLPMATFMQQSAQTTAALLGQMAEMAKTMAEMSAGPEESPAIKAIREVGNVVQGIASAATTSNTAPRKLPRPNGAEARGAQTPIITPPPAMNGLNEAPTGVLAKLKALLEAKEDPDKVAAEAIAAFPTPEFQKALEEAQEPAVMFERLMTREWLAANLEYANAFAQAFTRRGRAAGIFDAPEDNEAEEEAA